MRGASFVRGDTLRAQQTDARLTKTPAAGPLMALSARRLCGGLASRRSARFFSTGLGQRLARVVPLPDAPDEHHDEYAEF